MNEQSNEPGGYYLLSLRHSYPGDPFVWEMPSRSGYTRYVDEAGVFSAEWLNEDDNGRGISPAGTTRAIPAQLVRERTSPAPADHRRVGSMRRPGAPVVTRGRLRNLDRFSALPVPSTPESK